MAHEQLRSRQALNFWLHCLPVWWRHRKRTQYKHEWYAFLATLYSRKLWRIEKLFHLYGLVLIKMLAKRHRGVKSWNFRMRRFARDTSLNKKVCKGFGDIIIQKECITESKEENYFIVDILSTGPVEPPFFMEYNIVIQNYLGWIEVYAWVKKRY